jgi:hypothetical protein
MMNIPKDYPEPAYTLDNSKMDGFLGYFVKGNCNRNCHACNYCKTWAEKVITFNEPKRRSYIELYSSILNKLSGGDYYK